MNTPVRHRPFIISASIKGYSVLAMSVLPALLLALGLSALTGCGGQTSYPTAITIAGPSSVTIAPGAYANFSAVVTGGPLNAGVTWSLTGCTASACGTLSNITTSFVTYTAPATVTTSFTVTLTASAVGKPSITQAVTISVPAPFTITTPPGALAGATFGTAYTTTLAATGGFTPYTWSITHGSLPAGLTLNSVTGTISGTPTSAGTASFTVTLADSSSPALKSSSAFTITTLYSPLSITTTSLPHGVEGTAYSATLTAIGGSSTGYTWSVVSGTALSDV